MSRIFIENKTTGLADKNGVQLDEKTINNIIWGYKFYCQELAAAWGVVCPRVVYYTGKYPPTPKDWKFQIISLILTFRVQRHITLKRMMLSMVIF